MRPTICIIGFQAAIRPTLEPSRWWCRHQRDNATCIGLGQPGFATSARSITEAVNALGSKSADPLADGLRVTLEFSSNGGGTPAIPAPRDHLGADDPVAGRMTAGCEFANHALFRIVTRRACL